MSARAERRRRREEALAGTAPPVATAPEAAGREPPPRPPPPRVPARIPRLPFLPLLSGIVGAVLLAAAWATTLPPGEGRAATGPNRFVVDVPAEQQALINSWERFFICYDLLDRQIVDLTLRANQRATGSLDFPGPRVEVALPQAAAATPAAPPAALPSGGEEELIAVQQSIFDAAVPERIGPVRQLCAGGG